MKITDVTLTLFTWDGLPKLGYSGGALPSSSKLGLLRIITDDGVEGHAFLGSASHSADQDGAGLIRYLKPVLMGRDPLDRERLYQEIWARNRVASIRTIGAVDVALWDLAGKAANVPVHRLLGTYRTSIPAYASSAALQRAEAYVEDALAIKEKGWTAYKIHPPRQWRTDIKVAQAVRRAVGDEYTLMLDSTWTYDYDHAVRVGRAIEELDYYWYEDPLREQYPLFTYVKLREKLDIPIMATEMPAGGLPTYARWITERATDLLRGDVAVKGGITTCIKTAHLAEAFNMRYEVHHGGNSLNNLANLHVIMAIANTEFFEVILPDAAQKYGLVRDIEVDANGLVHAPTGPGLGGEIDFELIKRKQVAVLR